jgi:hypothetical protein
VAPNAAHISVREVLEKLECEFASVAQAVENGEFALWVGSGISRQAPNLGRLIELALDFLRQRAVDPSTASLFCPALEEAITLAGLDPTGLRPQYSVPLALWPEKNRIIEKLWDKYSEILDIRIRGESSDFILWNAIDIRTAFAHPDPPSAEHLCIGILIMEGVVHTVASGNWDGFIEAAIARLSNGAPGILQVVVDPDHLRGAAGRARLLKFHGCIVLATSDPTAFRKYLTASRTQITDWPGEPKFAAMRNAIIDVATNQKTMVLGLSIQDQNLQTIFAIAKRVNPWPWPCAPNSPGHVFCGEEISRGQRDVLRVVYRNAYDTHADDIHTGTHIRAWAEQVLLALVLKVLADKLMRLMDLVLEGLGKSVFSPPLRSSLTSLRDFIADLAVPDRTVFVNRAIALWSRMLAVFRTGVAPANLEAYEAISSSTPGTLEIDQNAKAASLGRLGVALALIQKCRADGIWTVKPPADTNLTSGVLTARANRAGALYRPLFIVKSASEAIALEKNGALARDNPIVIHGDDAWQLLAGHASVRRPRSAPGRTGSIQETHVSLEDLLSKCADAFILQQQFATEIML